MVRSEHALTAPQVLAGETENVVWLQPLEHVTAAEPALGTFASLPWPLLIAMSQVMDAPEPAVSVTVSATPPPWGQGEYVTRWPVIAERSEASRSSARHLTRSTRFRVRRPRMALDVTNARAPSPHSRLGRHLQRDGRDGWPPHPERRLEPNREDHLAHDDAENSAKSLRRPGIPARRAGTARRRSR